MLDELAICIKSIRGVGTSPSLCEIQAANYFLKWKVVGLVGVGIHIP